MRRTLVEWLTPLVGADAAILFAPTWFTFVGLAGLLAGLLTIRAARRAGDDVAAVRRTVLAAYLAAVACGILVPIVLDAAAQLGQRGVVRWRWAGMVSFWGMIGGFVAVLVSLRRHPSLNPARFGDLVAAPCGIALASARIGCFLAGCDYGQVSAGPLALRFPAGSPAWRDHVRSGLVPSGRDASLPVHPTQLYEVALGLALCVLAILVARSAWAQARAGRTFLATAAGYAIGRIAIETVRGDAGRGLFGSLSSAQIFCLLVLAAIAVVAWRDRPRHRPAAAAAGLALSLLLAYQGPALATPPRSAPDAEERPGSAKEPGSSPETGAGQGDPASPPAAEPAAETTPAAAPEEPPGPPPAAGPPAAAPLDPYAAEPPVRAAGRAYSAAFLLGTSAALNRRAGQVPQLAGFSLSGGIEVAPGLAVELDLDSMASSVASHGSLLGGVSFLAPVRPGLDLGGRVGLGTTIVNFHDPAFRTVAAPTTRLAVAGEWALGRNLSLLVHPLAIDLLSARALGGPIVSYQLRVGVVYRRRTR